MEGNRLTPVFLTMVLRYVLPPYPLPCIPTTAWFRASRNDSSDGLAHGHGRSPCPLLKLETTGIDDFIPELMSELKVFLGQVHPSIECLSYDPGHQRHQTHF